MPLHQALNLINEKVSSFVGEGVYICHHHGLLETECLLDLIKKRTKNRKCGLKPYRKHVLQHICVIFCCFFLDNIFISAIFAAS